MVLFTGLWKPSNYFAGNNYNDDDGGGDDYGNMNSREHRGGQNHDRQYRNSNDEERRRLQQNDGESDRQEGQGRHRLGQNRRSQGHGHPSPPRTITYGSTSTTYQEATQTRTQRQHQEQQQQQNHHHQQKQQQEGDLGDMNDMEKAVTWDDSVLSSNECGIDNIGPPRGDPECPDPDKDSGEQNETSSTYGGGGGGGGEGSVGTNTSSVEQQELPSLTAAFQSLENREVINNCLIYLAIYLSLAVVAYSYVFERWTIIDSLYFAVATFTTCGYGDLEPTTMAGRLFTIGFAIYGVVILGVFIAIFGSFISEAQTNAMKTFRHKKQHQMMETLFKKSGEDDDDNGESERSVQKEDIQRSGFWRDHVTLADDVWKVFKAEIASIGLVAGMALVLGIREGWDVTSTMYFCIMAATTTGYGDYTPTNQLDKLYCIILLPLAVAVFGEVLGRIATIYIQRKQRAAQCKFVNRSLTLCDIRNMDTNDDGKVDREDFILFMLVALQKVDKSTINELKTIFGSLDKNGNGLLEEDDLIELAEENYLPTLQRIRKELHSLSDLDERLLRDLAEAPVPILPDHQDQNGKHRRVHSIF